MSDQLAARIPRSTDLTAIARSGDLVLLVALGMSTVLAFAVGSYYGDLLLATVVSVPALLLGLGAFAMGRGRVVTRVLLTLCNVALIALHIQLARSAAGVSGLARAGSRRHVVRDSPLLVRPVAGAQL